MIKNFITSLLFLLFISNGLMAQEANETNDEAVIANLEEGVQSENLGLKVSSAYYLGEKRSKDSVIPLMKILKGDENPEARIIAALSLFKIGDEQGMFAVKRAIKFDDSPRVAKMCNIFYTMYSDQQKNK